MLHYVLLSIYIDLLKHSACDQRMSYKQCAATLYTHFRWQTLPVLVKTEQYGSSLRLLLHSFTLNNIQQLTMRSDVRFCDCKQHALAKIESV